MVKAYLSMWKRGIDFCGRSSRSEFWLVVSANFLLLVPIAILFFIGDPFQVIAYLYGAAACIPMLSILVRRLHDCNISGLWILLVILPFIGEIIVFFFTLLEGTSGDNKYGLDPRSDNFARINTTLKGNSSSLSNSSYERHL
jgi:uncharacterized membrane protein YhaH (DUF805 family)